MKKVLGIDIGGGSIRGSVIDTSGKIYIEDKISTNRVWSNAEFLSSIEGLISTIQKKDSFEKIGIGTPGPIDMDKGVILRSSNLVNLKNVQLSSYIQDKFKVQVFMNNDANCFALGEYHFGKGKNCENVMVFTLGTGIGCGWVYKGEVFNGYKGNGMESGHSTIVINGALCGCGQKGCAESYFSARGFLNRYREKTGKEMDSAKKFFELVRANDSDATEIFNFGVSVLAELIRNMIHTVNPQKIILVGGLTKSWDLFGEKLNKKVNEIIFPVFLDYTTIETGSGLSSTYGAASLCFNGESK